MMNSTLEPFATGNTDSSDRESGKSRKTFKKPNDFKDNSDGCIDTWVEVMRLHLEQDNLNDERQACTAILSKPETGENLTGRSNCNNWETIWYHEDRSENYVNNHGGRSRSNEEPE